MMFNFLKYEFKRSRKFNLFFFFLSLIITVLFAIVLWNVLKNTSYDIDISSVFESAFVFMIFVVLSINLLYFLRRYRNDIFSKSAYLTFTLDISTNKLFLAKMITALIVTLINEIIFTVIFSFMNFFMNRRFNIDNLLTKIGMGNFIRLFLYSILILSIFWLMAYALLTLAISLTRVKFFRRYYDFVSIVLFVVIFTLILALLRYVYVRLPYMIDFEDFAVRYVRQINGFDLSMLYMNLDGKIIGMNIYDLFISIFTIVISFVANIYVVEYKIDL
ncbi:MAG: ABC transporter permease [Tissierellia bacterium]|nr:ABC transporter permease [Tissierellia bacterium]